MAGNNSTFLTQSVSSEARHQRLFHTHSLVLTTNCFQATLYKENSSLLFAVCFQVSTFHP